MNTDKEKKVVKVKVYKVTVTHYDNGSVNVKRICDGFNPIELIGILEETQLDILKQRGGEFKPDQVERQFVKDSLEE